MKKEYRLLDKFYRDTLRKERLSYKEAFRIFEVLYRESRELGALKSEYVLDGIEATVRLARAINALK